MRDNIGGAKRATRTSEVKGRPGRLSQEDYAERVCHMLRCTSIELEDCAVLAQLPGVQRLAKQQASEILPNGSAIRALFDRAVGDVERYARASDDRSLERIAIFLQLWYRERQTVVRVAGTLGLSRTHVAREVQKRAVALVARRFLELAWRPDISA